MSPSSEVLAVYSRAGHCSALGLTIIFYLQSEVVESGQQFSAPYMLQSPGEAFQLRRLPGPHPRPIKWEPLGLRLADRCVCEAFWMILRHSWDWELLS